MKQDNFKLKIASGVLLVMVGIGFLLSDFVIQEREEAFSRVNIELNDLLASNIQSEFTEQEPEDVPDPVVPEVVDDSSYEVFAGVLEIPKIEFSKGFYRKGSELNDVKFNLKILDVSSYPDQDRGNVIIIGHSGNYSNSYFGNLYQLNIDDTASILYQGKKYNYKIVNIYNEDKDGSVTIYRDERKSCLTLITCTKDDDTKQTIYILERVNVE